MWILDAFFGFLGNNWKEIFGIILLLAFGKIVIKLSVRHVVRLTKDRDESTESTREKRAKTIGSVIRATGNTAIYFIVAILILDLFDVALGPILTGAGILGIAIGFGSQTLVRDFVSGLFIIFENQYAVGERVKISGFEGTVKKLTMRSTVLADDDGNRVYIANGSVNNVTNFSRKKK
jgi:moderate conductance mechanosensitive channel